MSSRRDLAGSAFCACLAAPAAPREPSARSSNHWRLPVHVRVLARHDLGRREFRTGWSSPAGSPPILAAHGVGPVLRGVADWPHAVRRDRHPAGQGPPVLEGERPVRPAGSGVCRAGPSSGACCVASEGPLTPAGRLWSVPSATFGRHAISTTHAPRAIAVIRERRIPADEDSELVLLPISRPGRSTRLSGVPPRVGERLVERWEDRKYPVHPGVLEDLQHVGLCTDNRQAIAECQAFS